MTENNGCVVTSNCACKFIPLSSNFLVTLISLDDVTRESNHVPLPRCDVPHQQ